jgi:hypothetical protein
MEGNNRPNPVIVRALLQSIVNQRVGETLGHMVQRAREVINTVENVSVEEKKEGELEALEMIKIACDDFYAKTVARLNKK